MMALVARMSLPYLVTLGNKVDSDLDSVDDGPGGSGRRLILTFTVSMMALVVRMSLPHLITQGNKVDTDLDSVDDGPGGEDVRAPPRHPIRHVEESALAHPLLYVTNLQTEFKMKDKGTVS